MPAVPKRRGWFDKEFAEYEIAAIVSAASYIPSTSDPFTISVIRSTESPAGSTASRVSRRISIVSPNLAISRVATLRNAGSSPVRQKSAINTDKL